MRAVGSTGLTSLIGSSAECVSVGRGEGRQVFS